ncbi:MAG: endonuclease domain-containing protein [Alphaproteobacteria bacterium]
MSSKHRPPPQPRPEISDRARRLRRDETEAERRVWRAIRDRRLGVKFRRQVPIGPYFADFACVARKLVVELDGGQHAEPTRYEEERGRVTAANGYRVLRFWNNDVMDNLDGVVEAIRLALEA